jgi:hypothetical protein
MGEKKEGIATLWGVVMPRQSSNRQEQTVKGVFFRGNKSVGAFQERETEVSLAHQKEQEKKD